MIMVGTAGWSIPRAITTAFPGDGTHLERYSKILPCAEINTSFYRPHTFEVYEGWAAQTPAPFRFSVKLPRTITHDQRLRRARNPLQSFLGQVRGLGPKLGPILVQLPPSLEFNARVARTFFDLLRECHDGPVVCEPRHSTWFDMPGELVLSKHHIGRVAADPATISAARHPGGWIGTPRSAADGIAYYRLHGSPRMYWSRYSSDRIAQWIEEMANFPSTSKVWCIFDNTASGAATENALEAKARQQK